MSELVVPDPDGIESRIARDLARRGAMAAPVAMVAVGLWRGIDGALAVGLALAVVLVNFLVAGAFLDWAARISPNALMGAALGGFIVRLGAVFGIAAGVQAAQIVDFPVFVVTVLVAHLGLLFWETRAISFSLASPGLKPRKL
jgi:ATP synthase protein I